ncbi:hypothetical protein P152DRAFT_389261, partial [Eremomyces bilateralis CBS 781.70]
MNVESGDENQSLDATIRDATGKKVWTRGDLSAPGEEFVPIVAAAKFPYKFAPKEHSEKIADRFFNAGKFHERPWEVFYLWHPHTYNALLLIPATQFIALLKEIQKAFPEIKIGAVAYWREIGLFYEFPANHNCLPRYLGKCKSKDHLNIMESGAPPPTYRGPGEKKLPDPGKGTFEEFKRMYDDAVEMGKNKSKAQKARKRAERVQQQSLWGSQLKRAQCYLGLLPRNQPQDILHPSYLQQVDSTPGPIDPDKPAPYRFDQRIIIVCVDIESYERDHSKITEIGIATLDTYDLVLPGNAVPGPEGQNWRNHIRARHFLIKDHKHLVNHEFVGGCPDKFRFGETEVISLADAPKAIASCFKEPYSAGINIGVDKILRNQANEAPASTPVSQPTLPEGSPNTKVVILGHDIKNDLEYLQRIGYNPLNLGNRILEIMDTIPLWKAHTRDPRGQGLASCLVEVQIAAWHLHNAGNDAVYTLQLFLGVAVREAAGRKSNPALDKWRRERSAARLESQMSELVERAKEEAEGWNDGAGTKDGG